MNTTLQYSILKELCPERIWQLTDAMKLTLDYQISRLPRRTVSDLETRYPTTLAEMRAFLEVFFTRHLFQVQNSLIDYMTSEN